MPYPVDMPISVDYAISVDGILPGQGPTEASSYIQYTTDVPPIVPSNTSDSQSSTPT